MRNNSYSNNGWHGDNHLGHHDFLLLSLKKPRALSSKNFSLGNRPSEMANKDKAAASMPRNAGTGRKESCRVDLQSIVA